MRTLGLWPLVLLAVATYSCRPFYLPELFHAGAGRVPEETRATPVAATTPHAAPSATSATSQEEVEESAYATPASTPAKTETKVQPQLAVVSNPAEQQAARQRAQQSIDQAAKRLAQVDRAKLTDQDIRDYDLIAGFVKDAQQAMQEQDFLKAEGLARKASVLATQLAGRRPSPR